MVKKLPVLAGLLVLVLAVPVTVFLVTEERISLTGRAALANQAQLWLWPASLELNVAEETSVQVVLATKEQKSGGLDLVLSYDPKAVAVVDNLIRPGVIFDYYRDRVVDVSQGLIKLSSKGSFLGQGNFASFSVRGIRPGKTEIEIVSSPEGLGSTVVWDQTERKNILGRVDSLTIVTR